jgi:hypothetical protein
MTEWGFSPKGCRAHYLEVVQSTDRSDWTKAEDQALLRAVREMGFRWVPIKKRLGGTRTAKQMQNRYGVIMRMKNKPAETETETPINIDDCISAIARRYNDEHEAELRMEFEEEIDFGITEKDDEFGFGKFK